MVNKVILVGNLGQDPEMRTLDNGTAVTSLRLATTERYKDRNGEQQEHTEWHSVKVWGKLAEIVNQYCRKGKQVYVEGKIQTRKWTDKEGHDRYSTEIVASEVKFLGGKSDDSGPRQERATSQRSQAREPDVAPPMDDGDIPF